MKTDNYLLRVCPFFIAVGILLIWLSVLDLPRELYDMLPFFALIMYPTIFISVAYLWLSSAVMMHTAIIARVGVKRRFIWPGLYFASVPSLLFLHNVSIPFSKETALFFLVLLIAVPPLFLAFFFIARQHSEDAYYALEVIFDEGGEPIRPDNYMRILNFNRD